MVHGLLLNIWLGLARYRYSYTCIVPLLHVYVLEDTVYTCTVFACLDYSCYCNTGRESNKNIFATCQVGSRYCNSGSMDRHSGIQRHALVYGHVYVHVDSRVLECGTHITRTYTMFAMPGMVRSVG